MALFAQIVTLMILLAISGFFSGAEVALVSLPKSKVMELVERKRLGAVFLKRLKDDPQRMLATILIGNNLVNVAAASFLTSIVINMVGSYAVGIATGVMTFLLLIFGEITPKSFAAQNNVAVALAVSPIIWALSIFLAPLLNLLDRFLNRFMKLVGIKSKAGTISEAEIMGMVKEAAAEGLIKETEQNLISRIFKFDDTEVGDISTPMADIAMISLKSTMDDALKLILKSKYSKIPVYERHRDNIVGIIYVKEVIKHLNRSTVPLSSIMKKPYFVPESKKISSLLRNFQKRNEHIAIVVNEHGSVTGLVTIEDILEEIVGEIMDETGKLDPNVKKLSPVSWLVKGKTEIEEVNAKLKMALKEDGYDTLSGFILKQTGKIPANGDELTYNDFKIKIDEVENHRISKVIIEKR